MVDDLEMNNFLKSNISVGIVALSKRLTAVIHLVGDSCDMFKYWS